MRGLLIAAIVVVVLAGLTLWGSLASLRSRGGREVRVTSTGPSVEVAPSDDDLSQAALLALWPLPRVIPGPYRITQREIDEANERVDRLRQWVETAPELSSRERAAYRGWLDFCAKDNKAAQVSLDTNEYQRFQAQWDADRRRDRERAERAKLPKPPAMRGPTP